MRARERPEVSDWEPAAHLDFNPDREKCAGNGRGLCCCPDLVTNTFVCPLRPGAQIKEICLLVNTGDFLTPKKGAITSLSGLWILLFDWLVKSNED